MEQLFYVKGYSNTEFILIPQRDEVEFDLEKLESYLQQMSFAQGEGNLSVLTEEEQTIYGCEEKGGLLFRHNDDPSRRWRGLPFCYITQDEEGNCDCPQFVVKMLKSHKVIEQMKKLNAPFLEAFCSDYELFKNPQKAYDYAEKYADHYDSLEEGLGCNRPSNFEVTNGGFELQWETRRGNKLCFCIQYEQVENPDWQEGDWQENKIFNLDISWVEYETTSSMMLEL